MKIASIFLAASSSVCAQAPSPDCSGVVAVEGDVGGREREEINYQPGSSSGGTNYEWERQEGTFPLNPGLPLGPGTLTRPILDYPRSGPPLGGGSVIGGTVYRGCRMPDLHGTYFFADWLNNWVASFRVVDGSLSLTDAAYSLGFLFRGGPAPAAPFRACSTDPTTDGLDCQQSNCSES